MDALQIYKIESLGAVDGPGLRTVIFLQGCPMHCGYCHNADSWDIRGGLRMSIDSIFDKIMRNMPYFSKNGGVTFSGGEPLLQSKQLIPIIRKLKSVGVHTAIDTSGAIFNGDAKALFDAVDLVILDVKHTDLVKYKALCGGELDNTIQALEYLKSIKKHYWIRQVILPGCNDVDSQIRKLSELTFSPFREKIELIMYHQMGNHKWSEEQNVYKIEFGAITAIEIERLKTLL